MTTPLEPTIDLEDRSTFTVCQCCGADDGTVRCLTFRWMDRKAKQGGGTTVTLCMRCRHRTVEVLRTEAHNAPPALERSREVRALKQQMLAALTKALKVRDVAGRRARIQHEMLDLVNQERKPRGFASSLTLADIRHVEQLAIGHSDYAEKFAFYCAEVATEARWEP